MNGTILLAGTGYSSLPAGPWNVGDVAQAMGLAARIRRAFPEATLRAVPPDPAHVARVPGVELERAPAAFLAPLGATGNTVRYARRGIRSLSLVARARHGRGGDPLFDGRRPRGEALAALAGARALLLCGMGDLCDSFAYLGAARWGVPAAAAAELGVPVIASGQQVGPLQRPDARMIARLTLRGIGTLGVRDPVSATVATSLGVARGDLLFTGDDAWDLAPAGADVADEVLGSASVGGPFVAVNARLASWTSIEPEFVPILAGWLDVLSGALGLPLLLIPMLAGPGGDAAAGDALRRHLRAPAASLPEPLDPPTTKAILSRAELAVGTGYHLCLLASSAGVPAVGLYRSAYMRQKMRGLPILAPGRAAAVPLRGASSAPLVDAAERAMAGSLPLPDAPGVPRPDDVIDALRRVLA